MSPVLSAPPQAVSVVQLTNSSSVSVSWEPPAHNPQSGVIEEYKVRLERSRVTTRDSRRDRRPQSVTVVSAVNIVEL